MSAFSPRARRPAHVRPPVSTEALEPRRLLAVMTVNGTQGDDVIELILSGPDLVASRDGEEVARSPVADTTSVVINLLAGVDTARVAPEISVAATINGGSGEDTIDG